MKNEEGIMQFMRSFMLFCVLLAACSDKAKASNDGSAQTADATATSTNSEADRQARMAKMKAAESARAAQAAADASAQASARAAQAAALRDKVTKKFWDADRDGDCTGKGLPPYRWDYTGGTYDEDEIVALADGCQHLFERHGTSSPNDATFCCPKKPVVF